MEAPFAVTTVGPLMPDASGMVHVAASEPPRCARLHARPTVRLNLDLPPLPRCPNLNAPARSPLKARKVRNGISHAGRIRAQHACCASTRCGRTWCQWANHAGCLARTLLATPTGANCHGVLVLQGQKSTSSKFESDLSGPNAVTRRTVLQTEAAVTVAALAVPKILPVPAWPACRHRFRLASPSPDSHLIKPAR
jgi:hypothetical protein